MTTTITESEIKLIYTEIVLLAIIGVFMFFYISQPIQDPTSTVSGASASAASVDTEDASWISGMITPTLGLPVGAAELLVVSSIILIPLTIMNAFVALRFIKDLATGWV